MLTRGKDKVDPFGPDHYEAARRAMKKAHQEGQLDRYLEFKRTQLETFDAMGDDHALEEFNFYTSYASELQSAMEH